MFNKLGSFEVVAFQAECLYEALCADRVAYEPLRPGRIQRLINFTGSVKNIFFLYSDNLSYT